jgi:hypothetical protein
MNTITINKVNEMYKWAKGDLFEAYNKPSMEKISSWRRLQDKMTHNGGRDLVVRSRNCHKYTAMWRTDNKLYIEYRGRTEVYEIVGA